VVKLLLYVTAFCIYRDFSHVLADALKNSVTFLWILFFPNFVFSWNMHFIFLDLWDFTEFYFHSSHHRIFIAPRDSAKR